MGYSNHRKIILFRVIVLLTIFVYSSASYSQSSTKSIQLVSGFNRIGFYNESNFDVGFNAHHVKLGVRHYTLDNFFEKNTIGVSLTYGYRFESKDTKFFFYPGFNANIFQEKKENLKVNIFSYNMINGIGMNLKNPHWSLNYQLGFGIILTKSFLTDLDQIIRVQYFNYEMSIGITYHLFKTSKTKTLE